MKKDKEWAKEQLEYYIKAVGDPFNNRTQGMIDAYKNVEHIINQLDEPETLSQEWIDENKVARIDNLRKMTTSDVVTVEKLQNLLVQKRDKPLIPQFVADYIEQSKKDNDSINQVFAFIDDKEDKDLWHWLFPSMYEEKRANQEVFMRAWLDGYEVAEEQKYILLINITDKASKTNYETFLNKRGIFHSMENESFNSEEFNWTEEEIKELESGEILFEHFATKVEEL